MTKILLLICISLSFNLATASELRCDSYAEVSAYCGVGDNNGCIRGHHKEKVKGNGKVCWTCAAPGTPGDPSENLGQSCPRTGRDHAKNPDMIECDEVTEKYVICRGNKYILSNETSSSLQRNIKIIDKSLPATKSSAQTKTKQK